jgi:DNA-binding transcriptional LysR family regulator
MNTDFIQTFVTLAKLRSFRATAKALNATPAAVSLRVKSLETDLGAELIDRSHKEFRLTTVGEGLLDYAKGVLIATDKMSSFVRKPAPPKKRVRLGVIETVVYTWLSDCMKVLDRDHPELEIDLAVDTSRVLQKKFISDELDLIVRIGSMDYPQVQSIALAIYPMQWVGRREFLQLPPEELPRRVLESPIVTFARGTQIQQAVEEILAGMAIQEDVSLDQLRLTCSHSVATIVQLVRSGFGLATIPSLFVKDLLESGDLAELPVQPKPPPYLLSLCRRVEAGPNIQAAVDAIRATCAGYARSVGAQYFKVLV